MEIKVQVKSEHIKNGIKGDKNNCPIAIAFREAAARSGTDVTLHSVNQSHTAVYLGNTAKILLHSEQIQKFISDFDEKRKVIPFHSVFILEEPADHENLKENNQYPYGKVYTQTEQNRKYGWNTIFISHQKDDENTALELKKQIEAKEIFCYLASTDDMIKGDPGYLGYHIESEMSGCRALIVIISKNTVQSWWVPFEIGLASGKGLYIGCLLKEEVELPSYLKQCKIFRELTEATNWATNPQKWEKQYLWENYQESTEQKIKRNQRTKL